MSLDQLDNDVLESPEMNQVTTSHRFVARIVSYKVSDLPKLKSLVETVKDSKVSGLIAAAVTKSGWTLRDLPIVKTPLEFRLVIPNNPELLLSDKQVNEKKKKKSHNNKDFEVKKKTKTNTVG